ncbi:MAG: 50S ribosomal protein L1 [Candidatus Andersenbacteria bacterium]
MRSKRYKTVQEKAPAQAVDLTTAVAFLREHARPNVDETIEVHIHLGVDPTKSDQIVRASVTLPAGAPKAKKIAVFADDAEQATAQQAGAAIVGGEELIAAVVKSGQLKADVVVATPAMMPKIAKIARTLGPQGLMPNPKTGTVSADPASVVRELLGGKLSFKMDQLGNIHEAVGKTSWETDQIVKNVTAVLEAVRQAKPSAVKGRLIKNCTLKSTMSPGIRVAL